MKTTLCKTEFIQHMSMSLTIKNTLWGNCAVECISKDKKAFTCAAAMRLQHIHSFDGVTESTFTIRYSHCIGCINDYVGKEISISV